MTEDMAGILSHDLASLTSYNREKQSALSVFSLRAATQLPPRSSVLDLLSPQLVADRRW